MTAKIDYFSNFGKMLCKKLVKETIFNVWRNEKYFSVLLIYQLSYLVTILVKSSTKILSTMISIGFYPNR